MFLGGFHTSEQEYALWTAVTQTQGQKAQLQALLSTAFRSPVQALSY